MIVDGRGIAELLFKEIRNEISHLGHKPHMTVFTCAPNFETQKYLALKRKKAHEVGIGMSVIEFPKDITTEDLVSSIAHARIQTDGIIVQLPLPAHIDTSAVLASIPKELDVDGVLYDGKDERILPPVVGAIAEIARIHEVFFPMQDVVVVGNGRLVGAPAEIWAKKQGARVRVVTKDTTDNDAVIKGAQILILGAGSPWFIEPAMIRSGVYIFDAGTSEDSGELKGDAHPDCAQTASLFTPVPGGIGPITIAILLRNLVTLVTRQ